MNSSANKTQENKHDLVSNNASKKQISAQPTTQLVDRRPEATVHSELQQLANNNSQPSQLKALQEKANTSTYGQEIAQLQAMADASAISRPNVTQMKQGSQQRGQNQNKTGLPNDLKSGIEHLSGYAMDDIKVHRNSDKPAQLQALAYAQGTDIHLGPGQEKHLPHEAWHVVQQKQGRVQPTVQKKGGININDNASLETEADVMGARALSTTQAKSEGETVVQRKHENGVVQKQENEEKLEDPKPDHPYMKVLGWGRSKNWTIFGVQYSTKFVYSGKASDWKKLLATLDSDYAANKYLVPFFAAVGCGGGNVKYRPAGNKDYLEGYDYKEATPSESDILELLKALYDIDSSTKSTVDLPNEFWFEGGSNVPRAYDASFDGLAAFISKYQTMIIADKSSAIGDVTLNNADVNKLATEGTRWSDPQINNPRVVEAMITNAFATAVASAKTVVSEIDNNDVLSRNAKQNEGIYMVRNSAIIINEALNSYGNTVKTQNDNIASVFDTAWGMIPVPKNVSSTIVGLAKDVLKKQLTTKWKMGGDYDNIKGLKDSYKEKYVGILSTVAADNNVDFTKNGILISIFESVLK